MSEGLVATSRDPRVATENFTTPGLFAIIGTHGRGIESVSAHPDEQEVVFLPSTVFLSAATARVGELPVLVVRQVELGEEQSSDPAAVQAAAAPIGQRVLAARARGTVEVTSPGKYAGDID